MNDARACQVISVHDARVRRGFSLVEVIVAIVLLAIVLVGMTALSLTLSRRANHNAGRSYATGLLTQEIDRAVAVPIDSLALKLGQTTIDTPTLKPWPFERSISISGRADSLTVHITIRALAPAQAGDSVTHSVLRTR